MAKIFQTFGSTGGDPNWGRVVALLYNSDTAGAVPSAGSVIDSSGLSHPVTAGTGVVHAGSAPDGMTYSRQFNGSGRDSMADSSDFAFGSDDFTIDFMVRPRVQPASLALIASKWNGAWHIGLDAAGANGGFPLTFTVNGLTDATIYATNLTIGAWQHVAIVRSGPTITIFREGAVIGSGVAGTGSVSADTGLLEIGGWGDSAGYDFDGMISNFRITKSARWTGPFTPPTLPLPTSTEVDSKWPYVKFLLLPKGASGAAPVAASEVKGKSISWYGDAQVDLTDSYPSVKFDGTGDYGTTENSPDLMIPASTPFSFEIWAKCVDATGHGTMVGTPSFFAANGGFFWGMAHASVGEKHMIAASSWEGFPGTLVESVSRADNTYHALCVERDGSNLVRLYADGAVVDSATISGGLTGTLTSTPLSIGNELVGYATEMKGSIYAIRLTVGAQRYGGAYTPTTPNNIPTNRM